MLSRVAENLYWMARYVERAENTARLISVNTNLLLDLPRGITPGWLPLVDIMGLNEDFDGRYKDPGEQQVMRFLIGDRKNSGSILSSLHSARENCRTVRDVLPRDIWESLNELYLFATEHIDSGLTKRGRHAYLKRIIQGSLQFIGIVFSIQSRDDAFNFLRIGRNLERADMTTRIIDVRSAKLLDADVMDLKPFDTIQWVSVLDSLSASQMYRLSMQTRVRRQDVLEFLFKDSRFPRAIRHCLDTIEECVSGLKNNKPTLRMIRSLVRKIDTTSLAKLDQGTLHGYIDDLQLDIMHLHNSLAGSYFLTYQEESQSQTQTI